VKRIAAIIATAGLAAASLLAPTAAQAYTSPNAPTIKSISITPGTPILRASGDTPVTVTVTFNAQEWQTETGGLDWMVTQSNSAGEVYDFELFDTATWTNTTETRTAKFNLASQHTGLTYIGVRYDWEALAVEEFCETFDQYYFVGYGDGDYIFDDYYYEYVYVGPGNGDYELVQEESCDYFEYEDYGFESIDRAKAFYIKAETKTSIKAAPKKVTKGKKVTVSGTLSEAYYGWDGAAGEPVAIYFDPKGSGGWRKVGTDYTDYAGQYAKKFKVKKAGKYQARYAGDTNRLAVNSGTVTVKIKK
jgi:hypothetical protein